MLNSGPLKPAMFCESAHFKANLNPSRENNWYVLFSGHRVDDNQIVVLNLAQLDVRWQDTTAGREISYRDTRCLLLVTFKKAEAKTKRLRVKLTWKMGMLLCDGLALCQMFVYTCF